jgi:hypothetical protein
MGKVEIKMYEGIFFDGYKDQRNFSSSFSAAAVDLNQSGLAKKKSLRSSEGETVEASQTVAKQSIYKRGALLDVVTLNYCTALGLIEVGVLEKPDMWTHHRMKRPHKGDQGAPRVKPTTIAKPGTASPQTVELFAPQYYHQPPTAQYPQQQNPPIAQYPQTVQYPQNVQYLQQPPLQYQQQYQQQYHQPHPQQYQHPPPAMYQQYQQVAHPPGTVNSTYPRQPW